MLKFDGSRDRNPKHLLFMLMWAALLPAVVPGCSTLELGETHDEHKAALTTAIDNAKPRGVDARQRGAATSTEPTPSLGVVGAGEHVASGPYGTIQFASFKPSPSVLDTAALGPGAGNSLVPPVSLSIEEEMGDDTDEDIGSEKDFHRDPDKWEFQLTPYLWLPHVEGDSTVSGQKEKIDFDIGDVLDMLTIGLSGRSEAWKGDWGIMLDASYLRLEDEIRTPGPDIDVDIQDANVDLLVAYEVLNIPLTDSGRKGPVLIFHPGAGLRYHYLKQEIDLRGMTSKTLGKSKDWVEMVLAWRIILALTDRVGIVARGDVGGFGVGSAPDLNWSVMGGLGYRLSRSWTLKAGYRYWSLDYSNGSGTNKFALDADFHGPWLGATFRF